MSSMPHVVFMNIAATGHMNPSLPVVSELSRRGVKVTYFVPEEMRNIVEAAGATWKSLQNVLEMPEKLKEEFGVAPGDAPATYQFPLCVLPIAAKSLPGIVAELKALETSPSVIVYDPFLPQALVAARVLGIPAVGMVTVPGPGVVAKPPQVTARWEASPLVQMGRKQIQEMYDYDVLEHGCLMEFYSPERNLATTIDELFAPAISDAQIKRSGHFPWRCVGPLMDTSVKRVAHVNSTEAKEVPWELISEAMSSGKRLLFLSMGTVANSHFYDKAFGDNGRENGVAELTGKDFLQHVFRTAFEAFGGEEDIQVLMAVGPQADVLEGLPAAPANFILLETVPQLDVLSWCHGFITHGGANSMHEALGFGVPMAVVPIFGDQPTNGDSVARSAAGISFRRPLETLTAESLKKAAKAILNPDDSNSYRAAAGVMMQKMKQAGGVRAAADGILEVVTERAGKFGGA